MSLASGGIFLELQYVKQMKGELLLPFPPARRLAKYSQATVLVQSDEESEAQRGK